jgi:hypothetical protein
MTTRAAAERVPIHTAIEAGQPAPTTTPGDPAGRPTTRTRPSTAR